MEPTKLPKPSQLKPPTRIPKVGISSKLGTATTSKVNETPKPVISQKLPPRAAALRRKSKSVSDLRAVLTKPIFTNENLPKTAEKSVPIKAGQKRPALHKNDDENKPKVSKMKIPDWDYKSRFQELQKKYGGLQEEVKQTRPKIAGFAKLEEDFQALTTENETNKNMSEMLQIKEINLTERNKKLLDENSELKSKLLQSQKCYSNIKDEHQILQQDHDRNLQYLQKLQKQNSELNAKLTSTTGSYENLQKLHENLKNECNAITEKLSREEKTLTECRLHITLLEESCRKFESLTQQLKKDLEEKDEMRRSLHNTIQDMKGNIRVFCRLRPPVTSEEEDKLQCSIFFPTEINLEIRKSRESVSTISGKALDLKQEFTFDRVFPPSASQSEVFEELSQLVQSALDGFHVCVFAYGQTGSGKTYTMQGSTSDDGMIPRTIDLIFEKIQKLSISDWTYNVSASFLEIYNESIRDLLDPNSTHNYELRYNEGRGVTVTNLLTISIKSVKALKNLMEQAHNNRATAATDFNEHSSRSHAVTKIHVEGYNSSTKATYSGSINLVDLAGSESARTSSAERMTETKNINKSLSTLGSVMLSLHNNDSHIPYRNSKLTFLLQTCLGGNSKTLMFVNISPFEDNFNETINSLRFASKVKNVKTVAKKNKMYKQSMLPVPPK